MSYHQNEKNILHKSFHHIPSNRGYIIDGKKHYGGGDLVNKGKDIVMIDSNRHLHVWLRQGYLEKELDENDTDWDCWTSLQRQKLVVSRRMSPCRFELANDGMCPNRFDPDHCKYFYHFSKYKNGSLINNNGLVLCKYHTKGDKLECWEKHNGEHARVFYHED